MCKKIIKKKYCRIKFKLVSPLAIGSGENRYTDSDIIKDSKGAPYIPASAIAGVIREALSEDEETLKQYFGYVDTGNSSKAIESKLMFYEANIVNDEENKFYVTVRDNVALDEYKTAKKGAKFDREILDPGVVFVTYIEQSFEDEDDPDFVESITSAFKEGKVSFGAKTMRGYGNIETLAVAIKEFDMNEKEDVNAWLDFIPEEFAWEDETVCNLPRNKELVLELELVSGISIRRYTTEISKDKTALDFEQLTVKISDKDIPVIPGTTWAGAFRSRMRSFGIDVDNENSVFGYVKTGKDNIKKKSKIKFSESLLKDSKPKVLSRNAIDRFSGGTKDSALFTEKTYYGGTTELRISWNEKVPMPEKECNALAATIIDLHMGFLAIGGETSIGRGLFNVKKIDGKPIGNIDNNTLYGNVLQVVKEVFK